MGSPRLPASRRSRVGFASVRWEEQYGAEQQALCARPLAGLELMDRKRNAGPSLNLAAWLAVSGGNQREHSGGRGMDMLQWCTIECLVSVTND